MAFSLIKLVPPKPSPKLLNCVRFFYTKGSSDDEDHQKLQNQLNRLHTYETIDNPNSLVKTTIIKRNPILQKVRTPEQMLEDAANAVAKNTPKKETKDETILSKSGRSDGTDDNSNDFKKNVYWGHDGKKSIVGYDILQELEERLEEILSRNEEIINPMDNNSKEKQDKDKRNDKVSKTSSLLHSWNRFLKFYHLRSYLDRKHW